MNRRDFLGKLLACSSLVAAPVLAKAVWGISQDDLGVTGDRSFSFGGDLGFVPDIISVQPGPASSIADHKASWHFAGIDADGFTLNFRTPGGDAYANHQVWVLAAS